MSTLIWVSRVPGSRPIYVSARSAEARAVSPDSEAGSGTAELSGAAWPGLVPQVTNGVSAEPSIVTSRSNAAPASVGSVRQ